MCWRPSFLHFLCSHGGGHKLDERQIARDLGEFSEFPKICCSIISPAGVSFGSPRIDQGCVPLGRMRKHTKFDQGCVPLGRMRKHTEFDQEIRKFESGKSRSSLPTDRARLITMGGWAPVGLARITWDVGFWHRRCVSFHTPGRCVSFHTNERRHQRPTRRAFSVSLGMVLTEWMNPDS